MEKKTTYVAFATLAMFTASASAATVLFDPTTNNGSFEDTTGATGATTSSDGPDFGGSMGRREARSGSGAGDINIPGWTVSTTSGNFGGINYSGSTASSDGLNNAVTNGSTLNLVSAEIVLTPGESLFTYSADFNQSQNTGGSYSLAYEFTDGAGSVIDTETIASGVGLTGGPNQNTGVATIVYTNPVSGSFNYTGSGTHVRIVASITGNQTQADNFNLSSAVVPEPSSALLAGLGLLAFARRRR